MLFHEIETERLFLKNISYEDREFILNEFSDDIINRYLFDAEPLSTLEEADEIISFYLQPEPRMQHRWILVLKNNNRKIGTCGFHCWYDYQNCIDIGYDLQEAFWGQGLMSEALNAILDFARNEMKIRQIHAHIYIDNIKSIRLAEKFGFLFHGETEICLFRNNQYLHNIYTLSISN
jgi:Acetyltransferases, including N-acetylases of ribosomal proteins